MIMLMISLSLGTVNQVVYVLRTIHVEYIVYYFAVMFSIELQICLKKINQYFSF